MDTLNILSKSGYSVGIVLGILAIFAPIPVWLPITFLVAAFVLHWQRNIKKSAEAKETEKRLYDRYAPDLPTRDLVEVQAGILERIDKLKAADLGLSAAFGERMRSLQEYLGGTLPVPLTHALLRDHEFICKYSKIGVEKSIAEAIETARALLDRMDNWERWLTITGTKPTHEELDQASSDMLSERKSRLAAGKAS